MFFEPGYNTLTENLFLGSNLPFNAAIQNSSENEVFHMSSSYVNTFFSMHDLCMLSVGLLVMTRMTV